MLMHDVFQTVGKIPSYIIAHTVELWFDGAMKPLTLVDSPAVVMALQAEIRRSRESRYDQRLHGVLLVAQAMSCPEVGRLLGVAPRTVEYWVRRFEERGLDGLAEERRRGRPARLSDMQLRDVEALLRQAPPDGDLGQATWDGKALKAWLARRYGVRLGVRQCQRMLRQFAFPRLEPYPLTVRAGSNARKTSKKLQA